MNAIFESQGYSLISYFYEGKSAKRSGVPYMNHINEGLIVLQDIDASLSAQEAYCVHPLYQEDGDFSKNILSINDTNLEPFVLALAIEYRSVANEYLPYKGVWKPEQIRLSPIKHVNDMLIADKVQNRKDFERNKEKYPNRDVLQKYFEAWLERLGVSEEKYLYLVDKIKNADIV